MIDVVGMTELALVGWAGHPSPDLDVRLLRHAVDQDAAVAAPTERRTQFQTTGRQPHWTRASAICGGGGACTRIQSLPDDKGGTPRACD